MTIANERVEYLLWTKAYPEELVVDDIIYNHGLKGIRTLIAHGHIPTHLLINKVKVETLVREVAAWVRSCGKGISPSFKADLLQKAILEKEVAWLNKYHQALQQLGGYRWELYTRKDRIKAMEKVTIAKLYSANMGKVIPIHA